MARLFSVLALLLVTIFLLTPPIDSKHHRRLTCTPASEPCPVHSHLICGTDGKLYPSRCHLRRAACVSGTLLRPAHPDTCLKDEEETDEEIQEAQAAPVSQSETDTDDSKSRRHHVQGRKDVLPEPSNEDHHVDTSEEEECHPQEYDLMKEKVLNKINDVSMLFTRLDENNDGQVTLNELWKHSMIYKASESSCLLTDLVAHEDTNGDEKLDYSEFQSAFNKLYSVTMVTLEENLAINRIVAHEGDNVEIRCDITGEPQRPAIKWYRHGVDLTTLSVPYLKVFSDGALYLTDLQLSFAGNYSCQAVNNPTVKQTHIVRVLVNPVVEVAPRFQWTPIGGVASFECRFETFEDDVEVTWFKNDHQLLDGPRVTILGNGTQLQVAALEQTDTGAYTCRLAHPSGARGQSVASLLVQDETVEAARSESKPQRLWVFHATGVTIYEGICGQPIHEMDGRDVIYQGSVTLCGNGPESVSESALVGACQWGDDAVVLHGHLYIAQPGLNRIVVFHAAKLTVVQIIATDPQPRRLWAVEGPSGKGKDSQVWVLCHGTSNLFEEPPMSNRVEDSAAGGWQADSSSSADMSASTRYDYLNEKYLKNRKTIQVVRLGDSSPSATEKGATGERRRRRQADVIHLQPVEGHFDLVYDLFLPAHYESIFRSEQPVGSGSQLRSLFQASSTFAYATHWEERALVKISLRRLEYLHSIRLADCQPIAVAIISRRGGGLVAVQCQTPVTHQLNGQLILDQLTDAILAHNQHLHAHQSHLSPDHRYLVNILHEQALNASASSPSNASTIIVQRVTESGLEFLYDVRTSLDIVSVVFVWKGGSYDVVLASGTPNREDLLYLSLLDGHVELISGIGRPSEGYRRGLAHSTKNRVLALTATESIFTVDLNTNRILCESGKHFPKPHTLAWTN